MQQHERCSFESRTKCSVDSQAGAVDLSFSSLHFTIAIRLANGPLFSLAKIGLSRHSTFRRQLARTRASHVHIRT